MVTAMTNMIDYIKDTPCDGTTEQFGILYSALNNAGVDSTVSMSLNTLCNANDGITQATVDAATSTLITDLNAVYSVIGGIYEDLVDINSPINNLYEYGLGNYGIEDGVTGVPYGTTGSLTQSTGNIATVLNGLEDAIAELQANQEDGITQSDLDAVNSDLQTAVDVVNSLITSAIPAWFDNSAEYTTETVGNAPTDLGPTLSLLGGAWQQLLSQQPNYAALEAQIANAIEIIEQIMDSQNYSYASTEGLEMYAVEVGNLVSQLASVTPQDPLLIYNQDDWDEAYAEGVASVTPEDGISQSDVDAAYEDGQADGAAGVTPEDGISQADVDAAYEDGVNSVQQNYTEQDIINAYDDGVASVTPEDGITQADVDAAYADGAASVTPEDGITQEDVDAAYEDGVASVSPEDGITSDNDVDESYADRLSQMVLHQ